MQSLLVILKVEGWGIWRVDGKDERKKTVNSRSRYDIL
jgi:hypothetical protein